MSEWNPRANEIFLQVVEIASPTERAAFLDRQCGGDATLRAEVESLLAASATLGSFLESPVLAVPSDVRVAVQGKGLSQTTDHRPDAEQPGTLIGRYKLRELIGEGGMGTVWIAEQTEPVRRKVALKLVKAGMDTKEVLSRFEVERQALALMDHPNIAKVHDGGITPSGRPYFVMEYVKGIPITQYCDEAKLPVRERLDLFVQVCHAVQHAHQKGIIHRDLKPSNILVCLYDGKPIPKIIDFGLAKAMHQPLTENTLYTAHGMMVGTPLYMSPEQAEFNNLDVDTRTDIYSLGVILYELLTGTTPLERKQFKDAALHEILRLIKEEDPQKPSTKISGSGALPTIAAQRGLEPAQLSRAVKGDLDWIAMKALEKDRSRRYESASGLARDVQRHLEDEPVEACPPSLGYKLRKLARRNQRAIATAGLLAVVILAALSVVAGSVGWAVRDRQNRQAVVERRIAAALDEVDARVKENRLAEADIALQQADGLVATNEIRPEVAAAVKRWKFDLGVAQRLADIEQGGVTAADGSVPGSAQAAAYEQVFDQYGFSSDPADRAKNVARILESPLRSQLITALHDGALSWDLSQAGPDQQDRLAVRARWLEWAALADRDAWRGELRRAIVQDDGAALTKLTQGSEWQQQPPALVSVLATHLFQLFGDDTAVQMLRSALQRDPKNFRLLQAMGLSYSNYFPSNIADQFYRACVLLRPDNPGVRIALAWGLLHSGQTNEAELHLREAIRLQPAAGDAHHYLGLVFVKERRFGEAEAAFRQAIQLSPGDDGASEELLKLFLDKEEYAQAEEVFRQCVKQHPRSAPAQACLGEALFQQKKWSEAEQAYRSALQRDPDRYQTHVKLGRTLEHLGQLVEAEAAFVEATKRFPEHAPAHLELAAFLQRQQRGQEAGLAWQAALRLDPDSAAALQMDKIVQFGAELDRNPNAVGALLGRGLERAKSHDIEGATADIRRALDTPLLEASLLGPQAMKDVTSLWLNAGIVLFDADQLPEAAAALERSLALMSIRQRDIAPTGAHDAAILADVAKAAVYLGASKWSLEREEESQRYFDRALAASSRDAVDVHRKLAFRLLSHGEWDRGARHLAIVVDHRPEDHLLAMQAAVLQSYRQDRPGYERVCNRMLGLYHDSNDPLEADRTAKACLLQSPPLGAPAVLKQLSATAVSDQKHWAYRFFVLVEALAAYRAEQWQDAVDACRAGLLKIGDAKDVPYLVAHYTMVRAMAEHRLGQAQEAQASLLQAQTIIDEQFPDAPSNLQTRWADWMLYEVLRREAQALLDEKAGQQPNASSNSGA